MRNFKNVDVVDCLKIIFNETTKNHAADFKFDIMRIFSEAQKARDEGRPRHLLWMAGRNGTWCVPEGNVYIRDAPENKIWCGYLHEASGINAFALEITGVWDNAAVGNVYELVYEEHAAQVLSHSFDASSVNIGLRGGETMNIGIDEFNYYRLQLEHDTVTQISYVLDGSLQKYHAFLTEIRQTRSACRNTEEGAPA